MGDAVSGRLMAVVFHNCGMAVNGHPHDLSSAVTAAKGGQVMLEMLKQYGASHGFLPTMMEAMEKAFAQ